MLPVGKRLLHKVTLPPKGDWFDPFEANGLGLKTPAKWLFRLLSDRLQGRVLLVHPSEGATDPGFGAVQATSKVRLSGPGHTNTQLTCPIWTSLTIIANLPANLASGTYTIAVDIVGPPPCSSTAQMQLLASDIVSDLAFAVASPATAELGATIEIINTKPGFAWEKPKHEPVDLITLSGDVVQSPPQVTSGWGTQELVLQLPPREQFPTANGVFPAHLKFDSSPHKLVFSVSKLPEVKPQILHLKRLSCTTTEDWTGADECRLEVKIDSLPFLPLSVVSLNDGEFHDFELQFPLLKKAEARLYDEDVGTFWTLTTS